MIAAWLAWLASGGWIGAAFPPARAVQLADEQGETELSPWDQPLDVLRARLQDDSEASKEACRRAAQALGERGPAASEAVPLLARALQSRSVEVRHDAVDALGRIGPAAAAAVPAILGELDLPADHVNYARLAEFRRLAARALGRIGPPAAAAVPPLRRALENEDALYRVEAALALGKIARDDSARPALEAAIRGDDGQAAFAAITSLPQRGEAAAAWEPLLIAKLAGDDADVCRAAAEWLAEREADLLSPLADVLAQDSTRHPVPTLYALERQLDRARTRAWYANRDASQLAADVDPALRRVGPALIGLLDDPREDVRRSAIRSLAAMGLVALPLLIPALDDPRPAVRGGAIDAMQRSEQTVPDPGAGGTGLALLKTKLVALLGDKAQYPALEARAAALRALARLGFGADLQPVLPQLRAALRDESSLVRRYAFEALDQVSPGSGEG